MYRDNLSPLARAIQDIDASRLGRERRGMVGAGSALRVSRMDAFIAELEQLQMRGGVRVPSAVAVRLGEFLSTLPASCHSGFPLRTRITYVLDELFEVQRDLLHVKALERGRLPVGEMVSDEVGGAEWTRTREHRARRNRQATGDSADSVGP